MVDRHVEDFEYPSEEVSQCPYPFYAALRAEAPVYEVKGMNAYQVARHGDVSAALVNWADFSSDRGWLAENSDAEVNGILMQGWPQRDVLLGEDPPLHIKHRKLVGYAFTPKRVNSLRAPVRELANELIDSFIAKGACDWQRDFADILPARVIAVLIGVPREDNELIRSFASNYLEWTARAILPMTIEHERECARGIVDFQRYVGHHLERARLDPQENLLGDLAAVPDVDDGVKIDLVKVMLVAGVETTSGLLGNVVRLLLEHEDQLTLIKAQPSLIPNAVEEALRIEAPAPRISRVVHEDIDSAGRVIPASGRVQLLLGSANRDDSVFVNPDIFDITRDTTQHVAFGKGTHFCIGAPLARLEATTSIELAFDRLKNLRLADSAATLKYRSIPLSRVLSSLPLEWDRA